MRLNISGTFAAEGTPEELAMYSALVIAYTKKMQEMDDEADMHGSMEELFRIIAEGRKQNGGEKNER